ncbi:hypothetical protein SVAN01_04654 [Stagonosporopsis vannaccii]|nr:hypothetical protein SVAN01_04654 [Stagonosporopsis vannaccii]
MGSRLNWQSAQNGVMLYMPATRVSIEDTQESMSPLSVTYDTSLDKGVQSQQSRISDTVLLSCEIESDIRIKPEHVESHDLGCSRYDSPDTLAHDESEDVFAEAISTTMSTPESSTSADLLAQLINAAEGGCSLPEPNPAKFSRSETSTSIEDYVDVGYDSDRTDFQEPTPSPSERQLATRKTSHHFQRKTRLVTRKHLARRLDFGTIIRQQAKKIIRRSQNAEALENLRGLERSPSHEWDDDERALLCVINRWYCGANRAAELTVFSKTFNAIVGLDLRPHIIRNQFEHLRLYGSKAYPVFGRVYNTPFDDPEGRYAQIRATIEQEAEALKIDLHRRRCEVSIQSGNAKHAKSPRTRSAYESLVRRASREVKQRVGRVSAIECLSTAPESIPSMPMAVQVPEEEGWERINDVELSPASESLGTEARCTLSTRPRLVFRVWDAASRTKFVEGSFVAEAFLTWQRPIPSPIALDDPSEAGLILTFLHLNRKGDTPVLMSTTSSLLQALSYAKSMHQPKIALINLDAPSLQEEHKIHHAADVFLWLKSQGLAKWARYKGNGEYIVWGNINSEAVLCVLNLEQLINDLHDDEDCRQLLNFDAFKPSTTTNAIASTLREKNAILNKGNARAMGKAAKMFGMNKINVTLLHIQDFVARLLDGWTIERPVSIDMQTMSTLAATFATFLGAHAGGYILQDIMGAFINGVEQGTRCIAHWSRSRSGSRRQRFRQA